MTDYNSIDTIIAALESAKEPSRELDFAIAQLTMGEWLAENGYARQGDGYYSATPPMAGCGKISGPQEHSKAFNAIERLVIETFPKARILMDWSAEKQKADIVLFRDFDGWNKTTGRGVTPALALCLAFARALKERNAG